MSVCVCVRVRESEFVLFKCTINIDANGAFQVTKFYVTNKHGKRTPTY